MNKVLIGRSATTLALFGAALLIASCGGGGSAAPTSPTVMASMSASANSALGTTLMLASVAGYTGTLSFSATPSPTGVTVNSGATNYAPPSALATVPPASLPTNPPGSQPSPAAGETPVVVVAWTFTTTAAVTVSQPTETFTGLPAPVAGKSYYSFFADMTGGTTSGYAGPGTYTAETQTLTFSGSANLTQLVPNHIYALQIALF